jgi:transposase-like protein
MDPTKLNLSTLSHLFVDEDASRDFLEARMWPNGPVCPHCKHDEAYTLTAKPGSKSPVRKGVYKCKKCRMQFTVRVGTIFEDSKLPLSKWLMALHLLTSSKKGMSSLQISRELGITPKSGWFMTHRIREAMRSVGPQTPLNGTVEVDETYVGGKTRGGKRGRGAARKTPVMVLIQRDGTARAVPVQNITAKELTGVARAYISEDSKIVTDDLASYRGIGKYFSGGHSVVTHSKGEYVNREGETTNTAESFFALLKRGHYGTFHKLSKHHLHRYVDEFSFRWNHRKSSDGARMVAAIIGAAGKRLMYRQPCA